MNDLILPEPSQSLTPAQQAIADAAREWGYGGSNINRRSNLWRGRRVLDIGMGGGPHCIPYLLGGATAYVGVDPLVGTDKVRDLRSNADPSIPPYHEFPYPADRMMAAFPNLHLFGSRIEDAADRIKPLAPEFITLSSVTEHLTDLEGVLRVAHAVSAPAAVIWMSHANYYSWTGHHRPPRTIEQWQKDGRDPDGVTDWQHLDPRHASYTNPNLNRVRLRDFRAVVDKFFAIREWRVQVLGLDRLTPAIRRKWKKYSPDELLARTVYVCAIRRDTPLVTGFDDRPLHHPGAEYLADEDHSGDDLERFRNSNLVYFRDPSRLMSHVYNDRRGGAIMAQLHPGDRITVQKFPFELDLVVKEVKTPNGGTPWVMIDSRVPDGLLEDNETEWEIVAWPQGEADRAGPRSREAVAVRSLL